MPYGRAVHVCELRHEVGRATRVVRPPAGAGLRCVRRRPGARWPRPRRCWLDARGPPRRDRGGRPELATRWVARAGPGERRLDSLDAPLQLAPRHSAPLGLRPDRTDPAGHLAMRRWLGGRSGTSARHRQFSSVARRDRRVSSHRIHPCDLRTPSPNAGHQIAAAVWSDVGGHGPKPPPAAGAAI